MKKTKIIILLLLMFCMGGLQAQTKILQPKDVFSMYFNAFVGYNDQSVNELNGYLETFLGKENVYNINMRETYSSRVDYYTNLFLSSLSSEIADMCREEAKNYFSVLMDNFKNSKYKVKTIKSLINENAKDQNLSEVTYEVTFKVPKPSSHLKIDDTKRGNAIEMKKYLNLLTTNIKKADKIVSTEQKFTLYQVQNEQNIYYWNGGPQELVWKLHEVYLKNIN